METYRCPTCPMRAKHDTKPTDTAIRKHLVVASCYHIGNGSLLHDVPQSNGKIYRQDCLLT